MWRRAYVMLRTIFVMLMPSIISVAGLVQTPTDVRLDPNRPSIYFSVERQADEKLWLRLHNNSHWAIGFQTENEVANTVPMPLADGRFVKVLPEGAEVSPEYVIENFSSGDAAYWCTSVKSWLAPGSSVLMSVNPEKLKPVGRLWLTFVYEWDGKSNEPQHRVCFSFIRA